MNFQVADSPNSQITPSLSGRWFSYIFKQLLHLFLSYFQQKPFSAFQSLLLIFFLFRVEQSSFGHFFSGYSSSFEFYHGPFRKDVCRQVGSWDKAAGDHSTQKLQDELLKLRRLQYYARYGDYAARVAHDVREITRKHNTEGWPLLSEISQWSTISEIIRGEEKEWSRISRDIHEEEIYWQAHGSGKNLEAVKTTYAVWKRCRVNGMDFDATRSGDGQDFRFRWLSPSYLHALVVLFPPSPNSGQEARSAHPVLVRFRRHPGTAVLFTHGGMGTELHQLAPRRGVQLVSGEAAHGSGSIGVPPARPIRPVLRLRRFDQSALRTTRPLHERLSPCRHAERLGRPAPNDGTARGTGHDDAAPNIPSRLERSMKRRVKRRAERGVERGRDDRLRRRGSPSDQSRIPPLLPRLLVGPGGGGPALRRAEAAAVASAAIVDTALDFPRDGRAGRDRRDRRDRRDGIEGFNNRCTDRESRRRFLCLFFAGTIEACVR